MIDQSNFLLSLGWAAFHSLWQMALLWITFQSINKIFKLKSSTKSSLATSLLIAGFLWFVYTFNLAFNRITEITFFSTSIINIQGDQQINYWFLQILPVVSIAYLSFLIFPLLRFFRNYRYVQIIRHFGLSKVNIDSKIYINKTAIYLGIKRKVKIWVSELVSSPVTIGFFKPIILVPLAAINNLSTQQLEAILLHELTHIKRSDYLINLMINIIRTILYFNPFVNALIKIIVTEREKSCDEMVLQFQYNSYEYAAALLELEKTNRTHLILTLAALGNKNNLLNRIENILDIQKNDTISLRKITGLFATICFIILMNGIFHFNKHSSKGITDLNKTEFGFSKSIFNKKKFSIPKKVTEIISPTFENFVNEKVLQEQPDIIAKDNIVESFVNTIASPALINASLNIAAIPSLDQYQEEQIKSALDASKKVLENNQWINVEENIAEVFTSREKNELKKSYRHEIEKFDWKKWENRLRIAYNNVNWDKVNFKLNNAIREIKMDSLQNIYVDIAVKLSEVQKELSNKKLSGIPDSDISIETIIEKKEMVQRILNELKAIKIKKIVHL